MKDYLEYRETRHAYMRDGKPLFLGTPDRVVQFPKIGLTVVVDYKMGRSEVPRSDGNMQLRSYLCMEPFDGEDTGFETEFRPSSLLRFRLCPGALDLQRSMTAQGLFDPEPTEDSMEGALLHKAISEPLAPRDYLTPEAFETVEKAERMEKEFIDFVLASNPILPFYGAICQPRTSRKADTVTYTEDDIVKARMEINGIWDAAHQEGAPRNASADSCKFCPCKALCPEYKSWVMAVEKIQHLPAATWDDEQWDLFLSRCGELAKFIEDRKNDAKAIKAANPDRLPGWTLKDGDEVRVVQDLPAAFAALSDVVSGKEFSQQCKISLGGIEETIWRARKDSPGRITQREAKAIVNAKLGSLVAIKQKAPSLVRKKP
jgi:hypothetical protein